MRHKTEPSGPKLFFCYFMFELRRTQRATVCAEKQRSDISQWYRVNYCRQYVIYYMALLNFNNKIKNAPNKNSQQQQLLLLLLLLLLFNNNNILLLFIKFY